MKTFRTALLALGFSLASVGFAAADTSVTLGQFNLSYPGGWQAQQSASGVHFIAPDQKHGIYIESFPAVTFEEQIGCTSYRYDLMRGAWQFTDLGGAYPVCVGFAPAQIAWRAATIDLGNGLFALRPYAHIPGELVIESTGQVLRIRTDLVSNSGVLDPAALAVFKTIRVVTP